MYTRFLRMKVILSMATINDLCTRTKRVTGSLSASDFIANFVMTGLSLKEWVKCRQKTIATLVLALVILVIAVLALTYGNYLGGL